MAPNYENKLAKLGAAAAAASWIADGEQKRSTCRISHVVLFLFFLFLTAPNLIKMGFFSPLQTLKTKKQKLL